MSKTIPQCFLLLIFIIGSSFADTPIWVTETRGTLNDTNVKKSFHAELLDELKKTDKYRIVVRDPQLMSISDEEKFMAFVTGKATVDSSQTFSQMGKRLSANFFIWNELNSTISGDYQVHLNVVNITNDLFSEIITNTVKPKHLLSYGVKNAVRGLQGLPPKVPGRSFRIGSGILSATALGMGILFNSKYNSHDSEVQVILKKVEGGESASLYEDEFELAKSNRASAKSGRLISFIASGVVSITIPLSFLK